MRCWKSKGSSCGTLLASRQRGKAPPDLQASGCRRPLRDMGLIMKNTEDAAETTASDLAAAAAQVARSAEVLTTGRRLLRVVRRRVRAVKTMTEVLPNLAAAVEVEIRRETGASYRVEQAEC